MPEGRASRFDLVEQTAVEELGDARIAAEPRQELQLDLDADHAGRLESGSSRVRQALGPDVERVAKGLRDRNARTSLELQAVRPRREPAAGSQRLRELLHEERHSLRAVVERRAQRRARLAAEDPRRDPSGPVGIERLHHKLREPPCTAEVDPEPSQRMAARDLLAAVGAEHEQWPLLRRFGERRKKLERRRVRPLEVVEEDDGRFARRDRLEGASHRFDQRLAIGDCGRWPELRQQDAEVCEERLVH